LDIIHEFLAMELLEQNELEGSLPVGLFVIHAPPFMEYQNTGEKALACDHRHVIWCDILMGMLFLSKIPVFFTIVQSMVSKNLFFIYIKSLPQLHTNFDLYLKNHLAALSVNNIIPLVRAVVANRICTLSTSEFVCAQSTC
jgi:hypothetical protein